MEKAAEPGLSPGHLVDAGGLKCPLPVLLARRALKTQARVVLVTTDPASVLDVPVFCAREGHLLMEQSRAGDSWRFVIGR
jgi:tRNA 2-thiouridine synthesizing protein A